MPTPVDNLTKDSSVEAQRRAVNTCIQQEIDRGKTPEQAAAMCHSMAKEKTGRKLTPSQ